MRSAAAPGGVQRRILNDSECRAINGASWPAIAPPKPAVAPMIAMIVSPRPRLRLKTDPIVVDNHFDNATPNKEMGIAANNVATNSPDPSAAPILMATIAGIANNDC